MEALAWYKNYPSEWLNKTISYQSYSVQGFFKILCDVYWICGGELTIEMIEQKYPSEEAKECLAKCIECGVLKVKRGRVSVSFLDEQLLKSAQIRKRNQNNGKKRASKSQKETTEKQEVKNISEPTGLPKQKPMGQPIREDKERDKEKDKKKNATNVASADVHSFEEFWIAYDHKMNKKAAQVAWRKLKPEEKELAIRGVGIAKHNAKVGGYTQMHGSTYLNGKRWEDSKTIPKQQKNGSTYPVAEMPI